MRYFYYALAGLNLICFLLFAIDKRRARRHRWRIPERPLFLSGAVFGALGGLLGMILLRHKTQHGYFWWGFGLMFVIQAAVIAALFYFKVLPV